MIATLVAVGYGAGSQLAFTWFNADGDNASFFPAAGVGLAALVLLERRLWPLVLATLAVTEIGLDVYHDIDLVGAVGYAIANAAQAFAGAVLLRRIAAPPSLAKTRDLGAFVACGVVAGPAIGGALGASTFVFLQEGESWLRFAWEWLVGDGLGALVVAGVALTMADPTTRQRLTRDNTAAFGLLLLATTASVIGVFWLESFSLVYLPVLLLAVAAVVTGPAGVAACGASIAFVGAQATARGHNFWDALNVSAEIGMLYLQTSIAYYIERLGFQLDFQDPDDDVSYGRVSRDGIGIMLKAILPDVLPQPNHTRHEWARWDAYIYTQDPDTLYDELKRRGASFVKELSFIDQGLWGFEVTDADKYVLAFFRIRNE